MIKLLVPGAIAMAVAAAPAFAQDTAADTPTPAHHHGARVHHPRSAEDQMTEQLNEQEVQKVSATASSGSSSKPTPAAPAPAAAAPAASASKPGSPTSAQSNGMSGAASGAPHDNGLANQ